MRVRGVFALICLSAVACGGEGLGPRQGAEGGPCYPNDTCDEGLVCQSGLCVPEPEVCTAGEVEDCHCAGGEDGTRFCLPDQTWSDCACSQTCGDGIADGDGPSDPGYEACDGTDLRGATCSTLSLPSGNLGCTPTCSLDTTDCTGGSTCGNDVIEAGEECEGADLQGATCDSEGYPGGGALACTTCLVDPSGCCQDGDGDGYGTSCDLGEDCDDGDPLRSPASVELPDDGIDNDCNGEVDEAPPTDCATSPSDPPETQLAQALGLDVATLIDVQLAGNPLGYGAYPTWGALAPLVTTVPGDGLPSENCAFVILANGPAHSSQPQDTVAGDLGITNAIDPAPAALQDGAEIHDLEQLIITVQVPGNAQGFSFDHQLLSAEYPEYVCSEFKDTFYVLVEGEPQLDSGARTNVAWDLVGSELTINSGTMQQAPAWTVDITGTGYEAADTFVACNQTPTPTCTPPNPCPPYIGSTTGWLRTRVPATGGAIVTLTFSIHDEGDGIIDTAVVIDNFRWLGTPVTDASTIQIQ